MDKTAQKLSSGKAFIGKVVSLKGTKTAIVEVTHDWTHPLYKKTMKRMKRIPAHNELTDLQLGEFVTIVETRPISRTKFFKVSGKII